MIGKVFKPYDVRATYPSPLNEEAAWKVGHAAAQYLRRSRQINVEPRVKLEDTMVVGQDMRQSSPSLAKSLADGIRSVGFNVIDLGMIDTPMLYFAINHLSCVGGIQTTASYAPAHFNGFKINGPKAKPIGAASGLSDIKRITNTLRPGNTGLSGKYEERDLWPQYRQHVLKFLDLQRPIKVAIDASNGMAAKMIPAIFGGAPNLEIIPILFEITGDFVHDPNPLIDANQKWLKEATIENRADLGICFDADADRVAFVDENGKTIGADLITALLARDLLSQPGNKGASIVYDLRSSQVVPDEIYALGGISHRERVGHAAMMKTMTEAKAIFGGELSGHFYFRDNFFADSGAVALARIISVLSAQSRPLSELIKPLARFTQSGEINFAIDDRDAKIRELAEHFKRGRIDYLDGISVASDDWWFNVRKSNADNLLRLNLEAPNPDLLSEKLTALKKILGDPLPTQ